MVSAAEGIPTDLMLTPNWLDQKAGTATNLRKLGFPNVNDQTLLVQTDPKNSSKEDRRKSVKKNFRIVLWSIFFLVPTGRGQIDDLPSGEEFEEVFKKLHAFSEDMPFRIKTTEAQHYRRFVIQQRLQARKEKAQPDSYSAGA